MDEKKVASVSRRKALKMFGLAGAAGMAAAGADTAAVGRVRPPESWAAAGGCVRRRGRVPGGRRGGGRPASGVSR